MPPIGRGAGHCPISVALAERGCHPFSAIVLILGAAGGAFHLLLQNTARIKESRAALMLARRTILPGQDRKP
jgi:hypothetical protein